MTIEIVPVPSVAQFSDPEPSPEDPPSPSGVDVVLESHPVAENVQASATTEAAEKMARRENVDVLEGM